MDRVIKGADRILNVFTSDDDPGEFISLLDSNDHIWGIAGVHPHEAEFYDKCFPAVSKLLLHTKVVGMGEIGLDYHYNFSEPAIQRKVFTRQLEFAAETKLPVVLHCREAYSEVAEIIKNFDLEKILIHCFSGDTHDLKMMIDAGAYIAFGGMLTFKNSEKLRDAILHMPIDKLLIESDSPYLAPLPYRGRRNEPAFVVHTAEMISELLFMDLNEILRRTYENASCFFNIN
jgi:TatD DNase family protein